MTNSSISQELLVRYVAGEAASADAARVERWVDEDPRRAQVIDALRRLDARDGARSTPLNVAALWRAIDARAIGAHHAHRGDRPSRPPHQTWPGVVTRIAAVGLAIAVAAGLWRVARPFASHGTTAGTPSAFRAPLGQRAVVQLRDGTHATLNSGSTLHYASGFGVTNRDVFLEGEAYFEAKRDMTLPFIVHTGTTTTRVLGTSFAVRRYPGDTVVRVAVASGRVDVGGVTLVAGDLGLRSAAGIRVTHYARMADLVGWIEGRIVFDDTPLSDVLAELSRWYGVQFRLAGAATALGPQPFSVTLTNSPIDDAVWSIATSFRLRAVRTAHGVTFYPQ
jgi:ferric-dicitrate binding protein FerR (iron transport regulator)